jgi:DNA modification methylase
MYTFRAVPEFGYAGDIVLDPFAGSGTSCVAARRLDRRYVGIDLSPEFCSVAHQRVAGTRPSPTILSGRRPKDRPQPQLTFHG